MNLMMLYCAWAGFIIVCTLTTFMAVLGQRFGGGGLQDLLVESGIIGRTASKSVISGKHYNSAQRALKLV